LPALITIPVEIRWRLKARFNETTIKMFEFLIKLRYLFSIAVVFLLGNAAFFMIAGTMDCIHGYEAYVSAGFMPAEGSTPGLYLLHGLDSFMVSIVFFVFGMGIARLFIFDNVHNDSIPRWLDINSIKELKVLLWETILVTLVIFCITGIITGPNTDWRVLISPLAILVLSGSLFLVKAQDKH